MKKSKIGYYLSLIYGQPKTEDATTVAPQAAAEKRVINVLHEKEQNSAANEVASPRSEVLCMAEGHHGSDASRSGGANSVLPRDSARSVCSASMHSVAPVQKSGTSSPRSEHLPPIEESGLPGRFRNVNEKYLLPGVGKAAQQHCLGQYRDAMRRSYIKC